MEQPIYNLFTSKIHFLEPPNFPGVFLLFKTSLVEFLQIIFKKIGGQYFLEPLNLMNEISHIWRGK